MKYIILITMFAFLSSCQTEVGPQAAIRDYISFRFSGENISKSEVLNRLTGKFYKYVEEMDGSEFSEFRIKDRYQKRSFKILSTKCEELTCYITYNLKYDSYQNNVRTASSEIKKIAELQKDGTAWKIADINNIKTFHNSRKTIEIL